MHPSAVTSWIVALLLLILAACTRSNNLLLGRVEANVDGHKVVVTDCYRTSVPAPTQNGATWRYEPCRDAIVVIRGTELQVNGTIYPPLHARDAVTVDHGKVLINDKAPDGDPAYVPAQ
jgi:hypothetical protein